MDSEICLHNATILTGISLMKDCAIHIKNDKIVDIYSEKRFNQKTFSDKTKIIDVDGAYIAPGFIDTHIHGIGGFSAQTASTKDILEMSEILAQYGVTSFIPTIGASPEDELIKKIKAIVKAMGKENGAKILGIHLEGPFLSETKIGAQSLDGISPVDLKLMDRLWKASKGRIINMTIAPELKNMRSLAHYAIEKGIVLQTGHSNATYDQMLEAIQVKILHTTHLFNAMSGLHHREPGVVGAVLIHPEMSCEIIADGYHVHPSLVQLLINSKSIDQLVLITDALEPTKTKLAEDSAIYLDKCFKRKADGILVGSAITMHDGFKNLISYGATINDAVKMSSVNPARIMKQDKLGLIMPDYAADLIIFDKQYNIINTIVNGKIIGEEVK